MRRRRLLGSARVGLRLAAAACVIAILVQTGDASLARLRESGTIRIGYALEAPFAFLDADGTVTGLLVRRGNPRKLHSYEQALAQADVRIAVESGVADGLAVSSPTVAWMAVREELDRTEVAQPFEQPRDTLQEPSGHGAFAFRREDSQLLEAWNAVLETYVGSREHLDLVARFGFTEADILLPSTGPETSPR